MAGLLRIILVAIVGFFALVAGMIGALLLALAALIGLVRRPQVHVRTNVGGAKSGGSPRPPADGDVIDVETTKVERRPGLK